MTTPGGPPWHDRSLEDLLSTSLGPGADHDPGLSPGQLGEGARRRAGQIRRRRSAVATTLGTGALVAITLVAVPALTGLSGPQEVVAPPPAASSGPSAAPSAAPSSAPSPPPPSGPSPAPSADPSDPGDTTAPAVEPLDRTPEGFLLVPDDVEPTAQDLPGDLEPAVSDVAQPSGAFLQNVVPDCAEAAGEGSSGQLGLDFLGSRTWTHPGQADDGGSAYAEARVDLFAPDAATTALLGLIDRATACQDAGLGVTVGTGRGEDQPGADGYVLVTGTTAGVPGGPEVGVPPSAAVLVAVRVGDVVVRSHVVTTGDAVGEVDEAMIVQAEQLAAAYLVGLEQTGTAGRLAVTP